MDGTLNKVVDKQYIHDKCRQDLANLIGGLEEMISLWGDSNGNALVMEDFLNNRLPKWHEAMCIRFKILQRAQEEGLSVEGYLDFINVDPKNELIKYDAPDGIEPYEE